jgi:hypothetical protein
MYLGVGDDVTAGTRFGGTEFCISRESTGDGTKEWQFMEWVYLAGGTVWRKNAVCNDWVRYELLAPASPATQNVGSGAYGKLAIGGGINMFVNPVAPGADGPDWDLNLAETLNANVGFSKVVPVPSPTSSGFFDWDPDTETVTYNATGEGLFNLFDAEISLGKFVDRLQVAGDGDLDLRVSAVKPKRLLAHWKHKLTLHNSTDKTGAAIEVAWNLFLSRKINT